MIVTSKSIQFSLLGGLVAQLAFEFYAWLISPLVFGPQLQPSNLIVALFKLYAGVNISYAAGFVVHALVGIVGFSAFVFLLLRVLPLNTYVSGILAGLVLWFVAQGVLAPLVGRDFMMGFGPYTQSSLVGHVGMTWIIALLIGFGDERQQSASEG